jgi:cytochrome c oxidase subunit 2
MAHFNLLLTKLFLMISNSHASLFDVLKPPVDISTEGHRIDYLFNFTTWLILFFFALVVLGLFGFSYFYSKKRHPKPLYVDGTDKKHILLVAFIGSMVFVLIDMQITTISNKDLVEVFANWPKEDENVVKVEVLAQQWAWNFRYAGKDGIFNTEDDVVTLNDLRLPVGKKIVFQVSAKDVIHAFFLPNARLKVDAMPGRISKMWTEFTKTGTYPIACAEMCGTFHYRMQARLTVYDDKEYNNWLAEAGEKANYIVDKENSDLFWGWKWQNPTNEVSAN